MCASAFLPPFGDVADDHCCWGGMVGGLRQQIGVGVESNVPRLEVYMVDVALAQSV